MRIFSTALSFIIFLSGNLSAQTVNQKTLLWEVSGKTLQQPSYLYGTFHLLCPADLIVAPSIAEKLKSTKQLYLEMDMDDPQLMARMQKAIMISDTTNWLNLVDTKRMQSASDTFQQLTHFPLQQLKMVKPFGLLSLTIPGLLGCAPASWEMTLVKLAKENNQEVLGLETVDRQMEVIDAMSLQEQATLLVDLLNNTDSSRKSFNGLIGIYKSKDIDKIQALTVADQAYGKFEYELLTKRNSEWVPLIEKIATDKPSFFAFGAAHLGGENGVIALLRKKGYTVKPIVY